MAPPAAMGFDTRRVLSRLFGALGRNLVQFLLLAALLTGLPTAATSAIELFQDPADDAFGSGLVLAPAAWLIGAMAGAVLQGAVIHGTVCDLSGRKAHFAACLAAGVRFSAPLFGIGLVVAVGSGLGCLILIVPGVLMALAWSVAAPVAVVERAGVFGALRRSRELTRNRRRAIFALALMAAAGVILQATTNAVISGGCWRGDPAGCAMHRLFIQAVANLIAQSANTLVGSAGVASLYFELRRDKEAVGTEQIAAVFN